MNKRERRQLRKAKRLATVESVVVFNTLYGAPFDGDCPHCGEASRQAKCPFCGYQKDSERITPKEETVPDIVVIDLETTGRDVDADRIVQFAAVRLDAETGEVTGGMNLLINPGVPIPPEATAVNRITDADVADCPRFRDVVGQVLDFIGHSDLCGHHMIAFDLPLLRAEVARADENFPLFDRRLFDTLEIFRHDVPHTLAGALRHYCGRDIGDDAHDALVDAQACAEVFRRQSCNSRGSEQWSLSNEALRNRHDELAAISLGDRVTLDGKIVRDADGDPCLSFGKHRGHKLRDVPKGFLRWMLDKDFTAETKAVVKRYL